MTGPRRPNESEIPAPRSSAPAELDPHPPAYRTPLPSLPRDPRVPSDFGQLPVPVPVPDERDTDPITGELAVSFDAEKTPHESPYSLKRLSEKMDEALTAANKAAESSAGAKAAARDAANNSVEVMSRVDTFARELKALARRVTSLEVSRQWAPLLLSLLAFAACVWLSVKVVDLQQQVQQLQHPPKP